MPKKEDKKNDRKRPIDRLDRPGESKAKPKKAKLRVKIKQKKKKPKPAELKAEDKKKLEKIVQKYKLKEEEKLERQKKIALYSGVALTMLFVAFLWAISMQEAVKNSFVKTPDYKASLEDTPLPLTQEEKAANEADKNISSSSIRALSEELKKSLTEKFENNLPETGSSTGMPNGDKIKVLKEDLEKIN